MRLFSGAAAGRARSWRAGLCAAGLLVSSGCRPDGLNDPEVKPDFAVAPTEGLVGEWKLDETAGAIAADTKNGYDATVLGGAAFVTGKIGNALNFDNGTAGTGGKYAQMPNNAVLDDVQEGDYSISAWFYAYTAPTDSVVENRNWAIVTKYGQHLGLVYEVGQKFSARHYLTGNVFLGASSTATYALNTWHHVASVVSKTTGTVKLYVNGALAATTSFTPGTAAREYGTTPFRIGRAQYQWAANGKVDQVRIYNRELTVGDISDLYGETIDNTPPAISAIGSAPAWDKAAIMWMTNEGSNSSVDYGLTSGYGSTSPVQPASVTEHTVLLTGLTPQTIYHYRVRSRDASGNTALSGDRTFATSPTGTLASFPGAQGAGATAAGGRGGDVYLVTSLANAGANTLRDCMQGSHSQPRTCVFRVGGTISLLSAIRVSNPNLTVAGQTAPGGGILIRGTSNPENMLIVRDSNVVLRYFRIRSGFNAARDPTLDLDGGDPVSLSDGAADGANAIRFVADHMSLSWSSDENAQVWDGSNAGVPSHATFSNVLFAEPQEGHATSFITGSSNGAAGANLITNIDVHHSMFSNQSHRVPLLKHKSSRLVNNIMYNAGFYMTQMLGGGEWDLIGNLYKKGPLGPPAPKHEIQASEIGGVGGPQLPSIHLSGNKGWSQSNPGGDQWLMTSRVTGENGSESGAIPSTWKRGGPMSPSGVPIAADGVDGLEGILTGDSGVGASARLDCNGNWVHNRDAVDERLMDEYGAGQGDYLRKARGWEAGVGGYPTIAPGTPCPDADSDGMPDAWETANGLNPNSAADQKTAAANGSGYTNLDMYLAGMRAR